MPNRFDTIPDRSVAEVAGQWADFGARAAQRRLYEAQTREHEASARSKAAEARTVEAIEKARIGEEILAASEELRAGDPSAIGRLQAGVRKFKNLTERSQAELDRPSQLSPEAFGLGMKRFLIGGTGADVKNLMMAQGAEQESRQVPLETAAKIEDIEALRPFEQRRLAAQAFASRERGLASREGTSSLKALRGEQAKTEKARQTRLARPEAPGVQGPAATRAINPATRMAVLNQIETLRTEIKDEEARRDKMPTRFLPDFLGGAGATQEEKIRAEENIAWKRKILENLEQSIGFESTGNLPAVRTPADATGISDEDFAAFLNRRKPRQQKKVLGNRMWDSRAP